MRVPAKSRKPRPRISQSVSFATPSSGLLSNRNLALPSGTPGAALMENFFPTPQGARLRRGMLRRATIPDGTPVRSLFSYSFGNQDELYAGTDTGIWDVTVVEQAYTQILSPREGEIIGPETGIAIGWHSIEPDASLYTSTGGDWSTIQFATGGGGFLIGVNGKDPAFIYDGSTWEELSVTFPEDNDFTTADFSFVWAYKQRIYFIQKGTLDVWYLPIDSIGGAVTLLPLGGVFNQGGTLVFGQTWSLSSGGSGGLSEQNIFVTTEGEVAVFQGLSPDPQQDWAKVGVYEVGKPLGKGAWIRAGGDIIIATSIGFIPLSRAISTDFAALGTIAVSNPVMDDWRIAVEQRGLEGWVCQMWGEGAMIIIGTPTPDDLPPLTFAVNVDSGAWARFTQWQPMSMATFRGRLFMGSVSGRVQEGWVGGSDEGMPYVGSVVPLFSDLGAQAQRKIAKVARCVIRSSYPINPQVTARFDWNTSLPPAPSPADTPAGNEWDNAIWDESIWNSEPGAFIWEEWRSVGGSGYAPSVAIQITSSSRVPLNAEIVRLDMAYDIADIIS